MTASDSWPELAVDSWQPTQRTLHMWLQVVGKVALTSSFLINHWWNASYSVSARGLRTGLLLGPDDRFEAEFDFIADELQLRTSSGGVAKVTLEPKSVATFYTETIDALHSLGLQTSIDARPNEVSPAIPFAENTEDTSYDADAVRTWWRQLESAERVMSYWRAGFGGMASPVMVFWGSMDLTATRFNGEPAPPHHGGNPPNCPGWVMQEAESQVNAAAGFWPGGSTEGSFYAYISPAPKGYDTGKVSVGSFDPVLGEWILPYEQVRTSANPQETLLTFLNETYALAADLGGWDRSRLDINPRRLDAELFDGANGGPTHPPVV